MDFIELFLGLIGRLLLGVEPGAGDSTNSSESWLKEGATPDPDG